MGMILQNICHFLYKQKATYTFDSLIFYKIDLKYENNYHSALVPNFVVALSGKEVLWVDIF